MHIFGKVVLKRLDKKAILGNILLGEAQKSYILPKGPKAWANKTGFNFLFLFQYLRKIVCNTILYMILQ